MSNDTRIIKEGGYQGTSDPGSPTMLIGQQIRPIGTPSTAPAAAPAASSDKQ